MALIDLPYDQLVRYTAPDDAPADFDAFWRDTLAAAAAHPLALQCVPVDTGLRWIESFDVTFAGYGGQPIRAWLNLPKVRTAPLPCIVEYIGYGGGRGFPSDWLLWSSAGYAHLVMDTRGQGSAWLKGDTADLEPDGSSPQFPGFMTRGILDPRTYYYRRVFSDAVRAIEAARSHPAIDATRIAVTGGSQGGGISIAAAGLAPDVALVMPDVPFLCHYRRATEITAAHPYEEIARFCMTHRDRVDQVFATLAYFDGVHFAARATGRALFSVGLMDEICPPSTVYAAYNRYHGPKEICVYRYNHHEGGGPFQVREKLRFVTSHWPLP